MSEVRESVPALHLVTEDGVLADPEFESRARGVMEAAGALASAGTVALHLRGPGVSGRTLFERGRDLLSPARAAGVLLLVNDRVDVALALEADGVQLAGRSLPIPDVLELAERARRAGRLPLPWTVGASVHDEAEAREAAGAGASFLLLGTIFASGSHPGRPGAGVELVSRVASGQGGRRPPVVAIGGVTPSRVQPVLDAGAWGVAVLSGVWGASDPARAVEEYLLALGFGRSGDGLPLGPGRIEAKWDASRSDGRQ